ncbi:sugar phosphate isomerase/epimerase [Nocardia terpenica]|uniref:sugar phosphate isomerase/epimerase family protein n=1 Tax=Nocardia terpenica TaxID=455432 RepID=UPI001893AEC4|nr:sugar phosphate isomerase/epimerase family protein [Nocardia terpenica]MBF6063305.1 sugar phosphate isomerase/epimerase [Nocardia terpenica]MBF6105861.1 sugar phosphate isomerase/epimerase [Nocardia terpenica]MBF6113555.1 sugar phosphate isomerase/epimerase [Nocardia terpenica]MBF6119602.1 sugar phosphate isomerase/epimerase [Nocardia terpenica]MBF6152013.1 sugar phosphate isomerase/epimerase [Nocardia terpenica]
MKFSYSTIACPQWSWQYALDQASTLGYDGIEWRLIDGKMVDADFPVETARTIAKATVAAGLGVPALDTSIQLTAAPGAERERVLDDSRRLLRLAAEFGAEHLRMFGGTYPETVADADALGWTQDALVALQPEARDSGVRIALELHDCGWDRAGSRGITSSRFLADVLSGVDVPEAGLQWDIANPFLEGEPAEQTWRNVRPWLLYLQVKDMVRGENGWTYVPFGEGELPIGEIVDWITAAGFDGWFSFEWEKWWHPEIAEAETVLPGFVTWMKSYGQA